MTTSQHPFLIRAATCRGSHLFAANDPLTSEAEAVRDHHRDEYESGLDAVPSARMERADPDRWSDLPTTER